MSTAAASAETTAIPPAAASGRRKMRGRNKLLLILLALVLMGVLRTGFLFVLIGLLPSIVSHYMDISKQRFMFKSIFACNLSGMLPFIGDMLQHGPSSSVLQQIMGTGSNWVIIYGAAFIGWILVQIGPMVAQSLVLGFHQSQIARIERMQRKIEEEWGPEVTQFSKQSVDH